MQPALPLKQARELLRHDLRHLQQVEPDVRDYVGHPGDEFSRVGRTLKITISAADDLSSDQQVSDLLRTAEPSLDKIAPPAADPPQAGR